MRPFLSGPGANTTLGAFTPYPHNLKSVDTLNRERTDRVFVHDNWSPTPGTPYGMYLRLDNTKYWREHFARTRPRPMIPLVATLKGYSYQVQNPTLVQKMPGYTYNLTTLPTHLSILLNKDYAGATPRT
jgi:hypothetical protein